MTAVLAPAGAETESFESGRVGPNAVIQLERALTRLFGRSVAARVFAAAGFRGLLDAPPAEMIDEAVPAALFRAVGRELPAADAERALRMAGQWTADYVLANRIPVPVKLLLRLLPARLAAPLLLKAIQRHAWTFAGSGACRTGTRPGYVIEITRNPLVTPGCVWHRSVFARLFNALVARGTRVRHTCCSASGVPVCRFEIRVG